MSIVAIVDHGLSNVDSIARAIEECGGKPRVTREPGDLAGADRIVLPGVGAYADAMRSLRENALDDALCERVQVGGVPFLGICLGMQLIATQGLEGGTHQGLGWIRGTVRRLTPVVEDERVPHVGWNQVELERGCPLFEGIAPTKDYYFVHSFHLDCADDDDVATRTPYCGRFVSSIQRDNIFAVQFHPEKSQRAGFAVLRNFLAI